MSWAVKCPLTVPGTLAWLRWEAALSIPGIPVAWPRWEARAGIINHPDSLGTFLPLIVARVERYHCYWSFEQFLVITDSGCGQDGNLLMTKASHLATLHTVVLSEALCAPLDHMGLRPASPSKWEAPRRSRTLKFQIIGGLLPKADGGALVKDSPFFKAQPSPTEKCQDI